MKKTPSLFKRDYAGSRQAIDEVVPGSEWVLAGEGTATFKLDGTSCLIKAGNLYRRFDRKLNKQASRKKKKGATGPWSLEDFKPAPTGFEPCEAEPNNHTGHWPGWVPVDFEAKQDQHHVLGFRWLLQQSGELQDGTYELVGPSVQNNPHDLEDLRLIRHGEVIRPADVLAAVPRDFAGLQQYLERHRIEGIVWHHPDGRMVKIKRRDFGYPWP